MKFINLKSRAAEAFLPCQTVLCIGNFDGVHLGHRQLVDTVITTYERLKQDNADIVTGAWFFDTNFYKTNQEIYTIDEKLEVFASLGLDYAIVADFNDMKSLSPDVFVNDVLRGECHCIHAVCGENFRFGAFASGDAEALSRLMDGNVTVVPLLSTNDAVISSSYIRSLLNGGYIERANYLLSRNYSISESVIHGKALGRKLGIPTINQNVHNKKLILKNGIYATVCYIDGQKHFGVTNVGVRPTVEETDTKNVETYIIDFNGDCYGKTVKLEFIHRIRDEMKFQSVDALVAQIQKDIEQTKKYFDK